MKKLISLLLSAIVVFSLAVNASATGLMGDVNSDGEINSADALAILIYSVGESSDSFSEAVADLNEDGFINSSDALMVLLISVGEIEISNDQEYENAGSILIKAYVDKYYDVCDLDMDRFALAKELSDEFTLYIEYCPSTDQLIFSLVYDTDDLYCWTSLYYFDEFYASVDMSTTFYFEGEEYYNYSTGTVFLPEFNEIYYNIYDYDSIVYSESTYDLMETMCTALVYQSDIFLFETVNDVSMYDLGFTNLYF